MWTAVLYCSLFSFLIIFYKKKKTRGGFHLDAINQYAFHVFSARCDKTGLRAFMPIDDPKNLYGVNLFLVSFGSCFQEFYGKETLFINCFYCSASNFLQSRHACVCVN